MKRIAIIGNSAGGKTRLSRFLSRKYALPLTHIDSIQFNQQLQIKPLHETRAVLKSIMQEPAWIIDGYGPLELLEERLCLADTIIFIDLPIWRHYFWCAKRQLQNIYSKARPELPGGANEINWAHTKKLFQTIGKVHRQMRPELIRILSKGHFLGKLKHITTVQALNRLQKD